LQIVYYKTFQVTSALENRFGILGKGLNLATYNFMQGAGYVVKVRSGLIIKISTNYRIFIFQRINSIIFFYLLIKDLYVFLLKK